MHQSGKKLGNNYFLENGNSKKTRSFRSADVGSGSKVHPTLNHFKAVVGAVVVVVVLVLVLVAVVAVVVAAVVSH